MSEYIEIDAEIDDDGAAKVDVGLMSMGMLDLFRQLHPHRDGPP